MGVLDDPIREVVDVVINAFVDTPAKFTRIRAHYEPTSGETVEIRTTADVKVSPPSRFTEREVNGTSILATDLKVLVATKAIEAAGLDLRPGTDITIHCEIDGVIFQAMPIKPIVPGDKRAVLSLRLRH